MRDLARSGLIRRKSNFFQQSKVLIVPVLIVIVILFVINIFGSGGGENRNVNSQYLSDAPKNLEPVDVGKVIQAESGSNVVTNSITLRNVEEGGQATAVRTYVPGSFTLTVNATLPDPKGNKYQVWITNGSDVFDAGFMNGSKTSWNVVFRNTNNFMTHREVWITREITSNDDKPEKIVMKGNF